MFWLLAASCRLLLPQAAHLVAQVAAADAGLVSVHEAGGEEVDARLEPQGAVFHGHLRQRGAHGVDADETVDAERGGEQPRHVFPERGDGRAGPRHAADEQQGQRREHEEDHARLAVAHGGGGRHGEKDARRQVGQHEKNERGGIGHLHEAEHARHGAQHVDAHHGVEHEIAQRFAHDDAQRPLVVAVAGRHEVAETVVFAGRPGGKADA